MATSVRDTYALAEKLATMTGRDPMSILRAACQKVRSTEPSRLHGLLSRARQLYEAGTVPEWLPDLPPILPAVPLRPESEEADWL